MIKRLFQRWKGQDPQPNKVKVKTARATVWQGTTINSAKNLYKKGKHKELSLVLPHLRDVNSDFVKRLMKSRLLTMYSGEVAHTPDKEGKLTFGADPEFILEDDKGEIIVNKTVAIKVMLKKRI